MKVLPSLKQLEYLVALVDTGHFGKAATVCNVTPSTLSAGIRDLEEVLGIPLAERTKRHVMILPCGWEMASRARLLLRDAEDIMELAASHQDPLTQKMNLGVIPTIAPFLLPQIMPRLRAKFPKLRLYLREEQTAVLLSLLQKGELDVALIALPYDFEGLATKFLFSDRFQFACASGHPLANHELILHGDLVDQPLLLLREGHCLREHAMQACSLSETGVKAEFEATSLHTLIQMVAAGLGVTLLPQLAIDAGIIAGTDIRTVPIAPEAATREIGLVWRNSSPRGKEYEMLGRELMVSVV